MTSVHPVETYSDQQLGAQGYYGEPPGAVPLEGSELPQGYYAPPGAGSSQGCGVPVTGAAWGDSGVPGDGAKVAYQGYAAPTGREEQRNDPANQIETRRWAAGLFDCFSNCIPNLFMSWCCPCVALAQIYARLGLGRYWFVLARVLVLIVVGIILQMITPGSDSTFAPTWDETNGYTTPAPPTPVSTAGSIGYLVIELALMSHVLHARQRVRQRFQIPGCCFYDCLVSCCCSCCAIAQMATHVKSYTPGSCSFGAPDLLPAFV